MCGRDMIHGDKSQAPPLSPKPQIRAWSVPGVGSLRNKTRDPSHAASHLDARDRKTSFGRSTPDHNHRVGRSGSDSRPISPSPRDGTLEGVSVSWEHYASTGVRVAPRGGSQIGFMFDTIPTGAGLPSLLHVITPKTTFNGICEERLTWSSLYVMTHSREARGRGARQARKGASSRDIGREEPSIPRLQQDAAHGNPLRPVDSAYLPANFSTTFARCFYGWRLFTSLQGHPSRAPTSLEAMSSHISWNSAMSTLPSEFARRPILRTATSAMVRAYPASLRPTYNLPPGE